LTLVGFHGVAESKFLIARTERWPEDLHRHK